MSIEGTELRISLPMEQPQPASRAATSSKCTVPLFSPQTEPLEDTSTINISTQTNQNDTRTRNFTENDLMDRKSQVTTFDEKMRKKAVETTYQEDHFSGRTKSVRTFNDRGEVEREVVTYKDGRVEVLEQGEYDNSQTDPDFIAKTDELLKYTKPGMKREKIRELIKELPPAVYNDIMIEHPTILHSSMPKGALAFYSPCLEEISFPTISLFRARNLTTLIHETGHAVDYKPRPNIRFLHPNFSYAEINLRNVFFEELIEFQKATKGEKSENGMPYPYFTSSIQELAAELYTWEHCPTHKSEERELAEKYFPKTVAGIKEGFKKVRNLPAHERRSIPESEREYEHDPLGQAHIAKITYRDGTIMQYYYTKDYKRQTKCVTERTLFNHTSVTEELYDDKEKPTTTITTETYKDNPEINKVVRTSSTTDGTSNVQIHYQNGKIETEKWVGDNLQSLTIIYPTNSPLEKTVFTTQKDGVIKTVVHKNKRTEVTTYNNNEQPVKYVCSYEDNESMGRTTKVINYENGEFKNSITNYKDGRCEKQKASVWDYLKFWGD